MMKINSQAFQNKELKTAVLFIVFNRPDTTKQVFEAIRVAKPPRLYIAADGPRANYTGDLEKVAMVFFQNGGNVRLQVTNVRTKK